MWVVRSLPLGSLVGIRGTNERARMPTNEPSGNDLTTHIGSCLYRERIAKEERNLRREWERPVPKPEVNPYDFLWLSSSPAEYWTGRLQQARQADAANQAKLNEAKKALAQSSPSTSSSAPARLSKVGGPPRRQLAPMKASRKMLEEALLPMTSSERMAARAAQRMVYGPSVADRLADEIAADMCHCGVEKWATYAPRAWLSQQGRAPIRQGPLHMA